MRRDYLGQSVDSIGDANLHVAPYDYQVGVSFQQQLFPFTSERAGVDRALAEVRRAKAQLEQARLDAEQRLRQALSARDEVEASWRSARTGLEAAQRVLDLTQSLYQAGRADLDSVEHALMDRDLARADVETLSSRRTAVAWAALRAIQPDRFSGLVLQQFALSVPP